MEGGGTFSSPEKRVEGTDAIQGRVVTLRCSGDSLIANGVTVIAVSSWASPPGLGGVSGTVTTSLSSSPPPRTSGLVALLLLLLRS